jgi:thiamine biosynthesis lipoprotein
MGTVVSVHLHLHDDTIDAALVDASLGAFTAELDRLEAMFSTYRPVSEISRISRGDLHLLDASTEVVDVLDACTWLEHASEGAFRARRPDRPELLDPAGFVKGWAAERASRVLVESGLTDWMLSAGGDVLVQGRPIDRPSWPIAIEHPDRPGTALIEVEIEGGAVATSGTAQRGGHVWNGRTSRPSGGLRSVTVLGPTLTWSDALATAVLAMGIEGIAWASRFDGHQLLAIDVDGRVLTSGIEIEGLQPPPS